MMKKLLCLLLPLCLLLCACKEESIDTENYIQNLDDLEQYILLGAYKDVTISRVEADDTAIAEYKATLQSKYAYYEKIDKESVEAGDCIHVSFVSYLNGEAFDGGSGEDDFVVGKGDFVFPEVETMLIGIPVGQVASVDVTVPDDYFSEGLRGKVLRMNITVKQIQEEEKTLPELTAEFVKEKFGFESTDEFDTYVREQVEKNAEDEMMTNAWKAALANCEMIKYPDGLVEQYVDDMLAYYTEQAKKYDAGPEVLLGDLDEWRTEATEYAKDYYKSEIAMYAILDREFGRDIATDEYNERLSGYAEDMGVTVSKLKESYSDNEIITSMYWDKVMELIWANTTLE